MGELSAGKLSGLAVNGLIDLGDLRELIPLIPRGVLYSNINIYLFIFITFIFEQNITAESYLEMCEAMDNFRYLELDI